LRVTVPARVRWLWLTLGVVIADRATKAWFETQTPEGWRHEVVGNFIYLVHSRNPGIAFGVLADSASAGTRIALIAGSIVVIAILAWMLVANRTGGLAGQLPLAGVQRGGFRDCYWSCAADCGCAFCFARRHGPVSQGRLDKA
jgi:lipoprotein signal peptidase